MNAEDLIKDISSKLKGISKENQLQYIKGRLKEINDPHERNIAELCIMLALSVGAHAYQKKTILVLIHGIRTHATWQEKVEHEVNGHENVIVHPIGYGYLDVVSFIFPLFFRKKPVKKILRELRGIRSTYINDNISIIAHSFGTYIISKILRDNSDIKLHRLLLCGSVISENFRWDMVPNLPHEEIINDVGSNDFWPVLAKSFSWGYGASGTFGFKTHKVKDRFHNIGHSGFFKIEFMKKFWIPYILAGEIVDSPYSTSRPDPPWWLSILSVFQIKLPILIGIMLFFYFK